MDTDWCKVWTLTDEVLQNDRLRRDLRPQALQHIMEYMENYQSYCRGAGHSRKGGGDRLEDEGAHIPDQGRGNSADEL